MNKHIFPVLLSAAVSLSLFSCSEKSQIQESETEITATETEITTSETTAAQTTTVLQTTTSAVSYMTTAITVTDAKGAAVTDTSGNTVTKIIAADENKKPVTDSKGEYIEVTTVSSSAAVTSAKTTTVTENTTTVPVTETVITTTEAEEQPVSEYILKTTWTCDGGNSSVNDSGTLMYINFRIKDNAAAGNYDITINSINENPWGSFINYTYLEKLKADFGHGTVSVGGSPESEDSYEGSEIYADVQNTSGNPGDNISVPVYIMNNPGDIGGFSFAFRYNASVLEYVSVSNGPLITSGTINTSNDLTDQ